MRDIGIGGVVSEISLLSSGKAYRALEDDVVQGLCDRFGASNMQAKQAIFCAVESGIVKRLNEDLVVEDEEN